MTGIASVPGPVLAPVFDTVDAVAEGLREVGYFADRRLCTAVFLAIKLQRPLLLEGEPGVGKTALARALSLALSRQLLRLQCYDGMEQREALYEWNYPAQLLHLRATERLESNSRSVEQSVHQSERALYDPRFLIRRPLLAALQTPAPGAVLLIDEVDRADEPFEAFLLEYLGEYQVSIPELGAVSAQVPPITLLTSNRTRDLNGAVKRRCLYHWLNFPNRARELAIVRAQVPQASEALSAQVVALVARLRGDPGVSRRFSRAPGIAETVEWARALVALDTQVLDAEALADTAGLLFKAREDVAGLTPALCAELVAELGAELPLD